MRNNKLRSKDIRDEQRRRGWKMKRRNLEGGMRMRKKWSGKRKKERIKKRTKQKKRRRKMKKNSQRKREGEKEKKWKMKKQEYTLKLA